MRWFYQHHERWQRRFWEHLIRDEGDLARHLEYCWINPVKHGLVTRARDWPHSTFHPEVRRGVVSADWAGAFPEASTASLSECGRAGFHPPELAP